MISVGFNHFNQIIELIAAWLSVALDIDGFVCFFRIFVKLDKVTFLAVACSVFGIGDFVPYALQ